MIKITFQNKVGNNVDVIPIISIPNAPTIVYTTLKTIFHTYKAVSFAGADLLYFTNCDRTTKQKMPMAIDMMPAPTKSMGCEASDDKAKYAHAVIIFTTALAISRKYTRNLYHFMG